MKSEFLTNIAESLDWLILTLSSLTAVLLAFVLVLALGVLSIRFTVYIAKAGGNSLEQFKDRFTNWRERKKQ